MIECTLEQVAHEALSLPRKQQIRLAHYLLALDDEPSDTEVETAWEQEIAARLKALQEGTTETIPWNDVQANLRETLRQCK